MEMTGGRGPDRCIDAVGAEAHGAGALDAVIDRAKQAVGLSMDRPHALRQAIMACRKAGTLSIPGVYIGLLDKVPFGAIVGKGLTIKTGQTHVQRYLAPLLEKIESGVIDPSFVITHRVPLEHAPAAYEKFRTKTDGCIKVVIKPGMDGSDLDVVQENLQSQRIDMDETPGLSRDGGMPPVLA
jgi:threonine dehydrogenase-like Zn-dependent dehydrogenase